MARHERSGASRLEWLSKTVAGTVLGYGLALALSGLFAWWGPGGIDPLNKYQFTMWIVPPLWLGMLSAVFLFRTAAQAWLCLAAANGVAFGALALARLAG